MVYQISQIAKLSPHQITHIRYDTLRDLVPFLQFKKRKKQPGRCVTFSKVEGSRLLVLKILSPS